ncbi:MAG: SLC13 family permease [Haloferacaceae archaeon]|nr:SLC13 family permease [Haloferacaceae archaeon]
MTPLTPDTIAIVLIIAVALVLFITEPVPVDITALGILVALLLTSPLSEMLVRVGLLAVPIRLFAEYPADALSGFSSAATLTVLAMFILSDGVQRTGVIQRLGVFVAGVTKGSLRRQLGATVGIVSPISGFINNTAAVAILLPMVTDIADRGNTSPSKLLLPLSYASMFGGMLTVIGTSTNILASELANEFLGEPFGMFEFTQLGIVITVVGAVYLMTVGHRLTPPRIAPQQDLTEEFRLGEYLTEVAVREDSPLVGERIDAAVATSEMDIDIVQLIREGAVFLEPLGPKQIQAGDIFAIRTDRDTLVELLDLEGLDVIPTRVDEAELEAGEDVQNLIEVIIGPGSSLVGESLRSASFLDRYDASVLALRRGDELIRRRLDRIPLRVGDALLVQATAASIGRLDANRDFIVAQEIHRHAYRESKTLLAVAIIAGVVLGAALTPVPIVVAALGGALAMVMTGILRPKEVYDAVQWDIIFLLAGVIPLGLALEQTGAAAMLGSLLMGANMVLPPVAMVGLIYVITAVVTNLISNNASVVLMIPIAVSAATAVGANAFAYVMAVTFAASTAFMTPVGYQTNLFVYGPGGYRFTDYLRVGGPLQLVFAVVTTLGISAIWGV